MGKDNSLNLTTHKRNSYVVESELGRGAHGIIDAVREKSTGNLYARKRIRMRNGTKETPLSEIQVMERLKHPHMIALISSFIQGPVMELLISPVADEDLDKFLRRISIERDGRKLNQMRLNLGKWIGCLANGLAYLHDTSFVRHKDIKPMNILVHGNNVLFADFGISKLFVDGQNLTTEGPERGTIMYCAPEVFDYKPRNTSADIFSLGCVFLEMLTCLSEVPLDEFHQYMIGESQERSFHSNIGFVMSWTHVLLGHPGGQHLYLPLVLCRDMLKVDPRERPAARNIANTLALHPPFCGDCCADLEKPRSTQQFTLSKTELTHIMNNSRVLTIFLVAIVLGFSHFTLISRLIASHLGRTTITVTPPIVGTSAYESSKVPETFVVPEMVTTLEATIIPDAATILEVPPALVSAVLSAVQEIFATLVAGNNLKHRDTLTSRATTMAIYGAVIRPLLSITLGSILHRISSTRINFITRITHALVSNFIVSNPSPLHALYPGADGLRSFTKHPIHPIRLLTPTLLNSSSLLKPLSTKYPYCLSPATRLPRSFWQTGPEPSYK
ncbi:hypothetical protein GP486_000928 [Trichoglossum hirsutum]|uniref:Protein kinase domain-containing protein n=1 Tax=Trichoglossum hirsutum TaxID=265104 RepID=A0A9P8LHM4_9PEZI|nr:hypothetical protein GP486_000928 [Trichoglossum hirsutum]